MGKKIFIFLLLQIMIFYLGDAISQVRYTPPAVTLGASFDMNFATNDAYGRVNNLESYGMRAGRGFDVFAKFGLGKMKRHRITTSIVYNKMINYDRNTAFFSQVFSSNPDDYVHTNFSIWTGTLGYEYLWGAPCCNKQHLGISFTFNSIGSANDQNTPIGVIKNSFRLGMQFNAGYEFMLGESGQYGLTMGLKYNWINLFNPSFTVDAPGATEKNLNDGGDVNGIGLSFTRWIGIISFNVGFNFYTGVKQIFLRK